MRAAGALWHVAREEHCSAPSVAALITGARPHWRVAATGGHESLPLPSLLSPPRQRPTLGAYPSP